MRTTATWTSYALIGLFGYSAAAIGVVIPYLRDEYDLSYGDGAPPCTWRRRAWPACSGPCSPATGAPAGPAGSRPG